MTKYNSIKLISSRNENCFFGYYDKNCVNPINKKILSHNVGNLKKNPINNELAKIGFYLRNENNFNQISETNAWNFQQGSMLQWIDNDHIIFNCFNKNYFAKIININTKTNELQTKYPIYSISDDKKLYSSINFWHINLNREGYGYQFEEKKSDDLLKIYSIKNSELLINITSNDVKKFLNEDSKPWVDHILFAKDSYNFTFLLRSNSIDKGLDSSLMYYDFSSKKIYQVIANGMAGHGVWKNQNEFVIWARSKKNVKNIQKKINSYPILSPLLNFIRKVGVPNFIRKNYYGDNFLIFNSNDKSLKIFNNNIPMKLSGGHFSFTTNQKYLISDTYHNKNNEACIFYYDLKKSKLKIIYDNLGCPEEINNKSYRCDLHPKLNRDKELFIDSYHEGFRGIYSLNLENLI